MNSTQRELVEERLQQILNRHATKLPEPSKNQLLGSLLKGAQEFEQYRDKDLLNTRFTWAIRPHNLNLQQKASLLSNTLAAVHSLIPANPLQSLVARLFF